MTRIDLPGGFIQSTSETWTDSATLEARPYWEAYSAYGRPTERFYTRAMAEYVIWVNHERIASERARLRT